MHFDIICVTKTRTLDTFRLKFCATPLIAKLNYYETLLTFFLNIDLSHTNVDQNIA